MFLSRLLMGSALGVASLALTAGAAFANTTVFNTGDHVTVHSGTHTTTNVSVYNSNYANIDQHAYNYLNTGYNSANRNIDGGQVYSGNANVYNAFSAYANSNMTFIHL